jgi:pyruvate-formate lyase-activating enzyme
MNNTKPVFFDPKIWGPHYWHFLHTIAMTYPLRANTQTKKKYYEFIQNLPLFIPVEKMSSDFGKLLNEYPVVPYLDTRESFIRWMHFIHNKINKKLEKPTIKLNEFYENYYNEYKPKDQKWREYYKTQSKIIYVVVILLLSFAIYYFTKNA